MRVFGFEITRAKKPQTRFLGDLVKVDLKAGDVCVLMAPRALPASEMQSITAAWRATIGDDVTLLIIDGSMKLGVLSPPQAAAVQERIESERAVEAAVG